MFLSYCFCDACHFCVPLLCVLSLALPPLPISSWFSPFRLAPRHDGGLLEGVDVGFPCHSSCVLLQFGLLHLVPPPTDWRFASSFAGGQPYDITFLCVAPPATLTVRGKFLAVACPSILSEFPSVTFCRDFPGFIAKPFRGVGVGYEEPCFRLMFQLMRFPKFLHVRLVKVG